MTNVLKSRVLLVCATSLLVGGAISGTVQSCTSESGRCIQGDCQKGPGIFLYEDGARYNGKFQDGRPEGFGTFKNPAGHKYTGGWVAGEKHGFGKYHYPGGDIYEGQFSHNQKHGYGTHTWADGTQYRGTWSRLHR